MKKIKDLKVFREGEHLMLQCLTEDGEIIEAHGPWINEQGLWASKDEARDPAEIAAWLRNFAGAIDRWAATAKAA